MITVVCGPPCSGKSTWVREHAGPKDLIAEIDSLYAAISGRAEHDIDKAQYMVARRLWDALLAEIKARNGKWQNAYVVSAAATQEQITRLAESVDADEVIVLDTPMDICLARAAERPDTTPWDVLIRHWFERRNKSAGQMPGE